MKTLTPSTVSRLALTLLVGALVLGLAWPLAGLAQDKALNAGTPKHAGKSADANKDLAAQVRELQAKIGKLEAALKRGHQGTPSGTPAAGGMTGMPMGMTGGQKMGQGMMGMGGMEGMKSDEMMGRMMQNMGQMMQMMGQMQGKGMGMMRGTGSSNKGTAGMEGQASPEEHAKHHAGQAAGPPQNVPPAGPMQGMMGGKGLQMMGGMKGMGEMPMPSALPGFPGASHIYHIGATGFFLDHAAHLKLTTKQQADLNRVKEKALLDQGSTQRRLDEAEQDLWALTASDQPDAAKIEAKVHEIEKLRGDQRLAFIRAVGEAAKVLTGEQRKALLGTSAEQPGAHAGH
jgi:Spy/CpxP family protein refolding chaperone